MAHGVVEHVAPGRRRTAGAQVWPASAQGANSGSASRGRLQWARSFDRMTCTAPWLLSVE